MPEELHSQNEEQPNHGDAIPAFAAQRKKKRRRGRALLGSGHLPSEPKRPPISRVFDQAGHIPHRTAAAAKHEDLVRIKKEQKAHLLRGPQSRTRRKWVSFGGQIRVPREIGVQSDESTGAISAAAKELDLDHEEEPASQAVTEPATATGLDLTTDEEFGHPSNDLPHPWDTNVAFRAQDDKVAVTESSTMQELDQEPDEELAYLGDDFSSYWNTNFATLNSRFDRGLDPGSIIERDNPPLVAVHAEEWARVILLVEDGKVNFLPFVAEGEHQHDWKQVWAHAMLWILHHEPHHGMRFLDITHTEPYLPRQLVADSALYLAMHFSSKSDAANCKLLAETLLVVMERPNAPRLCFDASHIRRLLRYCSPDLVLRLREGMKAHRVFVHGKPYSISPRSYPTRDTCKWPPSACSKPSMLEPNSTETHS